MCLVGSQIYRHAIPIALCFCNSGTQACGRLLSKLVLQMPNGRSKPRSWLHKVRDHAKDDGEDNREDKLRPVLDYEIPDRHSPSLVRSTLLTKLAQSEEHTSELQSPCN